MEPAAVGATFDHTVIGPWHDQQTNDNDQQTERRRKQKPVERRQFVEGIGEHAAQLKSQQDLRTHDQDTDFVEGGLDLFREFHGARAADRADFPLKTSL